MDRFASARKALGLCDICGFSYKLKELRPLYVKGNNTNTLACPECWNPDHPQLKLGEFPVVDDKIHIYNQGYRSHHLYRAVKLGAKLNPGSIS